MAKVDPGKIRQQATKYLAKGNWQKALEAYVELEKATKDDLRVPQKIAELHRRLGQMDKAVAKYHESAQQYKERGFLIQAIAVYKVIVEIAPGDAQAQESLSMLVEQRSAPSIRKKISEPEERVPLPPLRARVEAQPEEKPAPKKAPEPEPEPVEEETDLAMPGEDADFETDIEVEDEVEDEVEEPDLSGEDMGEDAEEGVSFEPDEQEDAGGPADDDYGMVSADGDDDRVGEEADLDMDLGELDDDGDNQEISLDELEVVPIECEESLPESGPERTPLFSDLEPGEFARVFELLESKVVDPGTVVLREGDDGDSIFIVARGEVRVTKRDEQGVDHELAVIGSSEFFGEIGYFHGKRRATVTAVKKCLLLEMSKPNLDQILAEFPRVRKVLSDFYRERVLDNLMALTPLFSHLELNERREIGRSFALKQFEPGQVIVNEGDPGDSMFLIKSGEVLVRTVNPDSGDDLELARLHGGDFFGEVSLVKNKPRTATIAAVTDTELLELSRADFKNIATEHPEIGAALEKTIERRVEDTIKKMLSSME